MANSIDANFSAQALLFPELDDLYKSESWQSSGVSILVVDDETRVRQSVCDLIATTGYGTTQASSVGEAIALLQSHRFTIALVDLNLGDGSGYEVMQFVKMKCLKTRLIVVSGESTFSSATEALRLGASDFVRKPYLPSALLEVLKKEVDKAQIHDRFAHIQELLKGSEQLHRFIVNHSPDIIYMLDAKSRFSFVNQRVETLLGYKISELIGKHYSIILYAEDRFKARFAFNERRTDERTSRGVELRLLNKRPRETTFVEARALSVELTATGVYTTDRDDSTVFVGTYGVIRDISERKRSAALVKYHLHHDHMTRLPNRHLFNDRLEMALAQARRSNGQLAILYLDVDRFKIINDSLGQLAGDKLLQMVTKSLKACLRAEDTLARVGGDEFLLLLPSINKEEDSAIIGQKILDLTATPFSYLDQDIRITFSIGIATYPQHASTLDELIRHARIAMAHIKQRGRNGYHYYSAQLSEQPGQELAIENDLHQAIINNDLELYFQPQIDIQQRCISGMEALVRWNHAEKGLLMPSLFIPIAEQTQLICALGDWVLDQSCRTARLLQDQGFTGLKIAVNVSMQQLERGNFPNKVLLAIAKHGVTQNRIEIEITESSIMCNMHNGVEMLTELAEKGIHIAIDDFGTGYSSLSYLQTLPAHTLKIDRSFIQNMTVNKAGSTIVSAILVMAKGLNMNCVAEGVETVEQNDILMRAGCRTIQGYYYSQAQPLKKLIPYLHKYNCW
jgi:diguanylate cyclase (GGDEF)-like protein/PAS domain S-box-containing protein